MHPFIFLVEDWTCCPGVTGSIRENAGFSLAFTFSWVTAFVVLLMFLSPMLDQSHLVGSGVKQHVNYPR